VFQLGDEVEVRIDNPAWSTRYNQRPQKQTYLVRGIVVEILPKTTRVLFRNGIRKVCTNKTLTLLRREQKNGSNSTPNGDSGTEGESCR
jgi:hypothetical protein